MRMKFNSERVQAKLDLVLSLLDGQSMTLREVAEQSGISTASMKHYLLHLHTVRAIYIDHYVPAGFTSAPVYAAGDRDDALRFVPRRDWTAAWIPTREAA